MKVHFKAQKPASNVILSACWIKHNWVFWENVLELVVGWNEILNLPLPILAIKAKSWLIRRLYQMNHGFKWWSVAIVFIGIWLWSFLTGRKRQFLQLIVSLNHLPDTDSSCLHQLLIFYHVFQMSCGGCLRSAASLLRVNIAIKELCWMKVTY